MPQVNTLYLRSLFFQDQFEKTVARTFALAEELLKEHQFDTIAFSGVSGAAMGFLLGYHLKLPLITVRKYNEDSHYRASQKGIFEGNLDAHKYLIVDDFISSGSTVRHILRAIESSIAHKTECVAVLMYAQTSIMPISHPITGEKIIVRSSRPANL